MSESLLVNVWLGTLTVIAFAVWLLAAGELWDLVRTHWGRKRDADGPKPERDLPGHRAV